jgi:hypothetical protein
VTTVATGKRLIIGAGVHNGLRGIAITGPQSPRLVLIELALGGRLEKTVQHWNLNTLKPPDCVPQ